LATGYQGLDDLDIKTKGKVYDLLATIYLIHGGLTQNQLCRIAENVFSESFARAVLAEHVKKLKPKSKLTLKKSGALSAKS